MTLPDDEDRYPYDAEEETRRRAAVRRAADEAAAEAEGWML